MSEQDDSLWPVPVSDDEQAHNVRTVATTNAGRTIAIPSAQTLLRSKGECRYASRSWQVPSAKAFHARHVYTLHTFARFWSGQGIAHRAKETDTVGRPSKLDDIRAKRIVDAIRRGLSRTAAAAAAGVSKRALMDWLARGRDGEAHYEHFLHRVQEAEGKAEEEMVACIRTAALDPRYWQAAGWWLERARPADWAKREPTKGDEEQRAESEGAADLEVARSVVAALESRKAS
jgi:hypothetical protein